MANTLAYLRTSTQNLSCNLRSRNCQRAHLQKFHQLLAVGRWFPPGTPVSSTRKLISSSSFHRLNITLAVAEALNPNKPNHKPKFTKYSDLCPHERLTCDQDPTRDARPQEH